MHVNGFIALSILIFYQCVNLAIISSSYRLLIPRSCGGRRTSSLTFLVYPIQGEGLRINDNAVGYFKQRKSLIENFIFCAVFFTEMAQSIILKFYMQLKSFKDQKLTKPNFSEKFLFWGKKPKKQPKILPKQNFFGFFQKI